MKYSATNTADEQPNGADTEGYPGIPAWVLAAVGGGALVIIAGVVIAIIALSRRNRSNRPPTPPSIGYSMPPYPPQSQVNGNQPQYGQAYPPQQPQANGSQPGYGQPYPPQQPYRPPQYPYLCQQQ